MNKLEVGSIIKIRIIPTMFNGKDEAEGSIFEIVHKIEGTKAITIFNSFNTKVYYHQYMYTYGKKVRGGEPTRFTVEMNHINDVYGKEDVYKDKETKDGYLFTGYQLETLARINPDKWRYTELTGLVKL